MIQQFKSKVENGVYDEFCMSRYCIKRNYIKLKQYQ